PRRVLHGRDAAAPAGFRNPSVQRYARDVAGRRRRARPGRDPARTMSATLDFTDVRTHGFVRVAVCVPEVRVADPAFNAEAHVRALARAHAAGAHYALCPELGLTAYS